MSTYNTYVGARYVPLLVGDWDTTKQTEYEPLTVVQYQGNSYTSRTYVPKNIDITNTEYWVVTGNYNAQIEAYREEVDNLKRYKHKFIFIGDSYSVMQNLTSWPEICASKLGLTVNKDYFKTGKDGMAWVNADGNTYLQALQDLNISDPLSITDIIIGGGLNDIDNAYSDIAPAMEQFATYVISTYPNAKIQLFIASRPKNVSDTSKFLKAEGAYFSYSSSGASGIGFIEGSMGWIYDTSLLDVTSHPNSQAAENLIGWNLSNYINTGNPYAYYRAIKSTAITHTDTPTTGNSYLLSGSDGRGNKYVGLSLGILTPSVVSANTEFTIGTCSDTSINMVDASNITLQSTAIIKTASNEVTRNISFTYVDGTLKAEIFGDVPSGNLTYIWVNPCHAFIPDIYC